MGETADSMPGKYTLAILYDISGVFDNVWWPSVLHRLQETRCLKNIFALVKDHLNNRYAQPIGKHGQVGKRVTRGCPQGSIFGRYIWNLIFDDLLVTLQKLGYKVAAYADDLLVLLLGNSRLEIEKLGQIIATIMVNWWRQEKFSFRKRKRRWFFLDGK